MNISKFSTHNKSVRFNQKVYLFFAIILLKNKLESIQLVFFKKFYNHSIIK